MKIAVYWRQYFCDLPLLLITRRVYHENCCLLKTILLWPAIATYNMPSLSWKLLSTEDILPLLRTAIATYNMLTVYHENCFLLKTILLWPAIATYNTPSLSWKLLSTEDIYTT